MKKFNRPFEEFVDVNHGLFIKTTKNNEFLKILDKENLIFGNVSVGENTDVGGWFDNPIKYCGTLHTEQSKTQTAIFYMGSEDNLLEKNFYYDVLYFLTPTRFYKYYGHGHARDFNYIKGKWK